MHPDPTTGKAQSRSRSWFTPIALLLGCSICLLPGLLVGGALGGALTWASNVSAWLAGGLALFALGGFLVYRRFRSSGSSESAATTTGETCHSSGCGCTSEGREDEEPATVRPRSLPRR